MRPARTRGAAAASPANCSTSPASRLTVAFVVERQSDMLVSTLASYLKALGADASLIVEVGQQTLTYDLTAGSGAR